MSYFDPLEREPYADPRAEFPAEGITEEPPPGVYLAPARPPRPPHPNFWWSILWCVGFLAFLFGTMIAVLIITMILKAVLSGDPKRYLGSVNPKDMGAMADLMAPAFLLAEIGSLVLAWVVVRLVVGPQWWRRLSVRPPSASHVLLALLSMPALLTVPSVIHVLAGKVLPSFGDTHDTVEMFGHWPIWFGVLVVGICPGLGEELWCRGFLGRGLVGHYGRFAGVALTSLFFGALHLEPPYAVATAVMGLWLHYVYLMSRSLPLSMLLHGLNNSIAVVLAHKQYEGAEQWINSGTDHYVTLAAACVLLVAVAWALFQSRARLVSAEEGVPPWRPVFPGVEAPPPYSGTRVERPAPNALAWALVLVAAAWFAFTFYLGLTLGEWLP
jgi:membrane protease YdiL (CAAX protease family)